MWNCVSPIRTLLDMSNLINWSTHPARFATSCFAPHHLSSFFFFFIHYFGITFTPPIDLGPFSNLSRGSMASVAVLRLRFIGFSWMLDHWFLLAIGNHHWWRHRCCLWMRNQFRLTGFLWGRYFCVLKVWYTVFILDSLQVRFTIRLDDHLAPILNCLLGIILLARGSIVISPVTLSLRYITLNGWILIWVSMRLGEIQSTLPVNKIVFFFQSK